MSHRYGRHGPHAWKRREVRKYRSRVMELVPVVPRVVTVFVQLPPIHAERIIVIVVPPADPYREPEQNGSDQQPLDFTERKQIGSSQDERTGYNERLKKRAIFEAKTKYDLDLQNVQDRGGDWPVDLALEREANTKANVALRDYIDSSLDLDTAKQFYVTTYLTTYGGCYQADTGNGTLPNTEMRKVQAEAVRDARLHKQESYEFSSEQDLNYHAILRIQELFGFQVRLPNSYLPYILRHLPCYKQAYKEERDRPARSVPFPQGGWQAGR